MLVVRLRLGLALSAGGLLRPPVGRKSSMRWMNLSVLRLLSVRQRVPLDPAPRAWVLFSLLTDILLLAMAWTMLGLATNTREARLITIMKLARVGEQMRLLVVVFTTIETRGTILDVRAPCPKTLVQRLRSIMFLRTWVLLFLISLMTGILACSVRLTTP